MSDAVSGLNARDDLLWIVSQWGSLRAALRPGGGGALTGMPNGGSDPRTGSVLNVRIADIMRAIEDDARFYGKVLMDETEWAPKTSAMPALLNEVAIRYGHFVAEDDKLALDFCDMAHQHREKVTRALEPPAPPVKLGPCPVRECDGELSLRDGRTAGTCRECGTPFTLAEQRAWLEAEFDKRLMTQTELVVALKTLGIEIQGPRVRKWVERDKLVEVEDGLYRLADAKALATTRKGMMVA